MYNKALIDNFIIELEESEMSEEESEESSEYEEEVEDNESEDELIQNIVSRQNASSCNPNPIKVNVHATDLSFHCESNLIAVSDVEGNLSVYDVETSERSCQMGVHSDAVRSVDYCDGNRIVSASSDSFCLTDIERKKSTQFNLESEIDLEFYCVRGINKDVVCSGHENGTIRLWDLRTVCEVQTIEASEDTINFLHYSPNIGRIHCTSGNGELILYDLRSPRKLKLMKKSDPYTSELTCCSTLRSDRNIVCGTGQGDLLLFSVDPFEFQPYRPNNSKKEILSIVSATENITITGNENGNIIAYHLYPNQPIGLIGNHSKWDITKLDINHSGNLLASLSEDDNSEEIKFWDITFLEDVEEVIARNREKDKTSYALPSSQVMSRQEFFSDLNEDDDL